MDRRAFLAGAAGLGLAPGALARGLGGSPFALVTAGTESHVAVVDLWRERVVARIATLPEPRSIETVSASRALVAHSSRAAVTLLDGKVRDVVAELRAFDEPRYAAADFRRHVAFVTDSGSGELVAVDVIRARVLGRVRVGGPARHLSIAPGATRVWVSLGNKAERVALVDVSDPARMEVVSRIRPPFLAHDVGYDSRGGRIWVTSGDSRWVAVHDSASGRLIGRLRSDSPPQHVTFVRDRVYVTSGADGTVRVHDAKTGKRLRTNTIPVGSYNVDHGGDLVVTPSLSGGTVCLLGQRGGVIRRVSVAPSSHDACVLVA